MGLVEYLLIGVVFGFGFEYFGAHIDIRFSFWERVAMWVFWPIVLLITGYHFFKELFNNE